MQTASIEREMRGREMDVDRHRGAGAPYRRSLFLLQCSQLTLITRLPQSSAKCSFPSIPADDVIRTTADNKFLSWIQYTVQWPPLFHCTGRVEPTKYGSASHFQSILTISIRVQRPPKMDNQCLTLGGPEKLTRLR